MSIDSFIVGSLYPGGWSTSDQAPMILQGTLLKQRMADREVEGHNEIPGGMHTLARFVSVRHAQQPDRGRSGC